MQKHCVVSPGMNWYSALPMIYRRIYTLLFYALLPVILLRLLFRSIKAPAYRHRWLERFGFFPVAGISKPSIWLHAVSVGETLAAVPLIKELGKQYPGHLLIVTTTTPTGSGRVTSNFAREIAEQKILHVYAPYDVPFALDNFLEKTKPQLAIVMETELWPNMIHLCHHQNIPVLVANARLSEKSARGYARFSSLMKNMLGEISCVAAQHQQDGNRFMALGLSKKKLRVTGSIKFDLDLSTEVQQLAETLRNTWSPQHSRLVLLAASTHPGEDEIVIAAFKQWKKNTPGLLLVLVPRHPERFNSVYQLCVQQGLKTERRSEMQKTSSTFMASDIDVVLGDTMGELLTFYGACDIAFVGGSLIPVGGHNLIEPAAWAKPIICGPYLFNFSEVAGLLKSNDALLICKTENELREGVEELLRSESKRKSMGQAAQNISYKNRGALQRLLLEIKPLIQ